jgi:hypothetical protein
VLTERAGRSRRKRRPENSFVYLDATRERELIRDCRSRRRGERGEGKLKALVYTVVFVVLILVAWKVVPPYVAEYQLTDKMQEQARFAVVNRYTDEQIRDNVYKEVQDLDIEGVKRDDIKVSATQQAVKISLDYSVPVDLFLYKTELHFTPSSENKSIM